MSQHHHIHQFHVKTLFKSSIRFVDLFNGKTAPIFIESLSDQYVVFQSHLDLPVQHNNDPVSYEFTIEFLNVEFTLTGVLLHNLTSPNATINTFEAKFDISDKERSNLFKLLNRYSIMINKLQREEEVFQEKKIEKKAPKKRFSIYG